jgi:hypothetical protein
MPNLRSVAVAAGLASVLAVAAGCNLVQDTLEDGSVSTTALTEIHLSGGSGDVAVLPDASVAGIDIRRIVRYRGSKPGQTYHIDGSVLNLDTSCLGMCSVSYVVRIPPRGTGTGVAITGDNGSGDVNLTGVGSVHLSVGSGDVAITDVTGAVTSKTDSGDTMIDNIAGDVTLTTSSGEVVGRDLRSGHIAVTASSGDVSLDLAGTGDAVVRTVSGNIDITVPNDTVRVNTDTVSGDRNVDVGTNPNSLYLFDLHTHSGDIGVKAG